MKGYTRPDVYSIRFNPRFDGDFIVDDPAKLLKSAPKKPTLTGITEVEMMVYGKQTGLNFRSFEKYEKIVFKLR